MTLHVEVLAAGPAALEHRAEMLGLLASRIANFNELARSADPALPPLPPAVFALYTGGLDELISDRLRTGLARGSAGTRRAGARRHVRPVRRGTTASTNT